MKRSRGFGLIEALTSVFILTMIFLFMVDVFPTTRKGLQQSQNYANAAFVASGLLDDARQSAVNNFAGLVSWTGKVNLIGKNNNAPFTQTINYAVNVQNVDTDKKRVTATATWHDPTGDKSLTEQTLIVYPWGGTP